MACPSTQTRELSGNSLIFKRIQPLQELFRRLWVGSNRPDKAAEAAI